MSKAPSHHNNKKIIFTHTLHLLTKPKSHPETPTYEVGQSPTHITPCQGILQDQSCDLGSDELEESPLYVPDLATCSELCEAVSGCTSASLHHSGLCHHFHACTNIVSIPGAMTVILGSESRSATDWVLVGYGRACAVEGGEINLQSSPGITETLSLCLESCEQSMHGCKSITFSAGKSCTHFSTTCDTTKLVANTASFRIVGTATAAAKAPAGMGQHVVMSAQSPVEVGAAVYKANTPCLVAITMVFLSTLFF